MTPHERDMVELVDRLRERLENWAVESIKQAGEIGDLKRHLADVEAERDALQSAIRAAMEVRQTHHRTDHAHRLLDPDCTVCRIGLVLSRERPAKPDSREELTALARATEAEATLAWGREALEGAVAAWTTERDFYAERAQRKGYSHDEAAAEAYGAAIKAVTGILAALDAPGISNSKEIVSGSDSSETTTERTGLIAAYAAHLRSAGDRADAADAVIAQSRAALAAFDGRGVNNFDVPTPREVLDAWRTSLAPETPEKPARKVPDRIDYDSDGDLDDVFLNHVDAHLERMNDSRWYLGLYGDDGRIVQIDIVSKTGRAEVTGLVKYSEGIAPETSRDAEEATDE